MLGAKKDARGSLGPVFILGWHGYVVNGGKTKLVWRNPRVLNSLPIQKLEK